MSLHQNCSPSIMLTQKYRIAPLWILFVVTLNAIHRDIYHVSVHRIQSEALEASIGPQHNQDERKQQMRKTTALTPNLEETEERICADWNKNMDLWWTNHPDWEISDENETGYCFSPMKDKKKAEFFRELYHVQYNSDCNNVRTVELESNGWGESLNVVDKSLLWALENHVPIAVHPRKGRWHYAAKKDASSPVCPRKDMSCYFLNVTSCTADPNRIEKLKPKEDYTVNSRRGRWAYQFATRGQTWLRHEVYKLSSTTKLVTPCTVMHVRRTDAVLEKGKHRKYHTIQEYVDGAGKDLTNNIFLLTDDQNAIEEAIVEFPQYNWMYMDRPRHRGTEGGFESHIPSDDPKYEVTVILATFGLVRQCQTFVYARSRFATQIRSNMLNATMINLDEGKQIYKDSNDQTVNISKSYKMVTEKIKIQETLPSSHNSS